VADSKLKIWITDSVNLTGLKSLQGKLKSFGDGVKKAFRSKPVRDFKIAVLAVGAALVGAVKEAVQFNVQVARVNTMAGGGIKNFKELRTQARGLASDYGLAASSIAKGMYDALSAGVDKANLGGVMNTAAKIAVADGSDVSTAVDGITTVLNAFGYQAEESEEVADKLFQTVKQGKTTFGELASNIATVAPMAAASNIPLEQILAHVASLTASGTPTAQAMTQIRASIQGMNKALGDGWSDNMTYQDALKKVWSLAGESQTELLKMVGSTEAVQAVLAGVGEKAKMADDKLKGMADSAGATDEAFKEVDQFRHWNSFFTTAWETLKKLGAEIDERLAPYVRDITAEFRKWQEDKGLWDKIRGFLDGAESRIKSIAEIVGSIKSIDDLKLVAGVIGEYFKGKLLEAGKSLAGFLAEKAPIIGDLIGKAIRESATALFRPGQDRRVAKQQLKQRGIETTDENVDQFVSEMKAFDQAERGAAAREAVTGGSEGKSMSWDDAVAMMTEGLKEGAAEAVQESSKSSADTDKFLAALEAGLTGDELTKAIEGLELMQEDKELLAEHLKSMGESADEQADAITVSSESMKKSSDAAKKTAEEAKKSSDANVEANKSVQEAMTKSTTVSNQTLQVAQTANSQIDQLAQAVSMLAAQQIQTNSNVELALGQIASMRM
jgi:TP901 family phage tail tape measure protein